MACEKVERLALQVAENVGAQRVHNGLAHARRQECLNHADALREHREPNHRGDEPGKLAQILVRNGLVHGAAHEERLHDGEAGGRDDERHNDAERAHVRAKKRRDAREVDGREGKLFKVLGGFCLGGGAHSPLLL